MRKSIKKKYQVRNWSAYTQSLKQRGSLSLWLPLHLETCWYGSGRDMYSDIAIEFCLTISILYHLPLRQTQGFVADIFKQSGISVTVPDYTTLCRRRPTLNVTLPTQKKDTTSLILDSTGLKVYGEGEWKVRKHGWQYRRTWRKVHLGIDSDGEIRALSVTHSDTHDCTQIDTILEQTKNDTITDFYGDGAYDTTPVYMLLEAHSIPTIHIPPRKDAVIKRHGNTNGAPWVRDTHLRQIRTRGRARWKKESGYHTRSLVETAMYRFKTIFGDTLSTRGEVAHLTDIKLKARILNIFTHRGMPDGVMVPT